MADKEPQVKYGSVGKPYFDEAQKNGAQKNQKSYSLFNERDIKFLQNLKGALITDLKKAGDLRIDYTPEIERAQGLFTRLSKGDTAGYDIQP